MSERTCPEIECNGTTWKVGHPTGRAKELLNSIIIAEDGAALLKQRGVLPAEMYDSMEERFQQAIADGEYRAVFGAKWQAAMRKRGPLLFLFSLIKLNHPKATVADVERICRDCAPQVKVALLQVIPDFFPVLAEDERIPPEKRGELAKKLAETIQPQLDALSESTISGSV